MVIVGALLVFSPQTLIDNISLGVAPTWTDFLVAIPLGMIAYTGIETASAVRSLGPPTTMSFRLEIGHYVAEQYRDALALAFDDARAEAQVLAERAGARLGAVLSIEETTQTEPVPQASASAPAGVGAPAPIAPPVQPGESRLDASVVVVFELVG